MLKKILGLFILMILCMGVAYASVTPDYYETVKMGDPLTKESSAYGITNVFDASSTNPNILTTSKTTDTVTFTPVQPGKSYVTVIQMQPTMMSKMVEVTVLPQFLFAKSANAKLETNFLIFVPDNNGERWGSMGLYYAESGDTTLFDLTQGWHNLTVKDKVGTTTLTYTEGEYGGTDPCVYHKYYVSVADIEPQVEMDLGDTVAELENAIDGVEDNFGNKLVIGSDELYSYIPDDFKTTQGQDEVLSKPGTFTLMVLKTDSPKSISLDSMIHCTPFIFTVKVNPVPIETIECKDWVGNDLGEVVKTEEFYTMTPENADKKAVDVTSSNTNIATVDADGNVKCVGIGECKIKVASKDDPTIYDTFDLTVKARIIYCKTEFYIINTNTIYSISKDDTGEKIGEIENATSLNPDIIKVDYLGDNQIRVTALNYGFGKVEFTTPSKEKKYLTVEVPEPMLNTYVNKEVIVSTDLLNQNPDMYTGEKVNFDTLSKDNVCVYQGPGWNDYPFEIKNNSIVFTPNEKGIYILEIDKVGGGWYYNYIWADDPILVEGVELVAPSAPIEVGTKYQLETIIFPEDATDKTVTYKSYNPDVAKVDKNGVVTALKNGKATIVVTTVDGGFTDSVRVECKTSVKNVTLSEKKLYLNTGDKYQLIATVNPETASDKSVKWVSSDSSIAYVSQVGKVYAKGRGTATITVITRDGSKKDYCKVYVNQPVKSVKLNKSKVELFLGGQDTLVATVLPENANNKGVVWTSSDSSVVSVSQNGRIKGKGLGTATITVTTKDGGYTAKCKVTVVQPVTGVVIAKEKISIKKGAKEKILAVVLPSNAKYKSVIWSSSNPNNVSVDKNGVVKGLRSNSSAYIKVTTVDGGYTDKVLVYVK